MDSVRVQWFADPMVHAHILCDVALKRGLYVKGLHTFHGLNGTFQTRMPMTVSVSVH